MNKLQILENKLLRKYLFLKRMTQASNRSCYLTRNFQIHIGRLVFLLDR